jgi:hypothetical protein
LKIIRIDDIIFNDDNLVNTLVDLSNAQPCAFGIFSESFPAIGKLVPVLEQLPTGYKIVLDRSHQSQAVDWPIPALYIDWHLLRVNNAMDTKGLQNNSCYNSVTNKFLFLTGKPHKLQRIKLLWMYAQANLLDRAVWSLFLDNNIVEKCRKFLPELDESELAEFLAQHQRNPDNIELEKHEAQVLSGTWWQKNLYEQTSLNVVSATEFVNNSYDMVLCEKIWKPIINCQPFIVAGQQNTLTRLKELGFQTFEKYMIHPDYSTESNAQEKLKKIVVNTAGFLDNINIYQTQVIQDVEHNYNHFFQVVDNNMTQLQEFVEDKQLILDFTGRHL